MYLSGFGIANVQYSWGNFFGTPLPKLAPPPPIAYNIQPNKPPQFSVYSPVVPAPALPPPMAVINKKAAPVVAVVSQPAKISGPVPIKYMVAITNMPNNRRAGF